MTSCCKTSTTAHVLLGWDLDCKLAMVESPWPPAKNLHYSPCFVGLRSGEQAGHDRVAMTSCWRTSSTAHVLWGWDPESKLAMIESPWPPAEEPPLQPMFCGVEIRTASWSCWRTSTTAHVLWGWDPDIVESPWLLAEKPPLQPMLWEVQIWTASPCSVRPNVVIRVHKSTS